MLEEKEKCKDSIQKLMKIIITQGETELTWTDLTSMMAVFRKYNSDPAGRLEGEGGGNRQF